MTAAQGAKEIRDQTAWGREFAESSWGRLLLKSIEETMGEQGENETEQERRWREMYHARLAKVREQLDALLPPQQ